MVRSIPLRLDITSRGATTAMRFAMVLALAPLASAHFLWQRIEPGARPRIELSFGEQPEEATSAALLARLTGARAWDKNGIPIELASETAKLTATLPADVAVVAGSRTWGLVDRTGDGTGAFFLEYYSKAALSVGESAASMKLPLEVFARREGTQVVATVRRGDAAQASTTVHVYTPISEEVAELTTDANGTVRFEASAPGLYGLRARWIEPRAGESEGKRFAEVRHYSTLTFYAAESPAPGTATGTVTEAAAAKPATANPAAYSLLKGAHDARQVMPADYLGFRCEVMVHEAEKTWTGTLVYRRGGETEVEIKGLDAENLEWVRGQLLNAVGHRRGGNFAEGDGKYPLELAEDDGNPFGRLILLHDKMDSRYRVRDDKVFEVTRTSDESCFTITVVETMEADDGKYLANHFLVSYRDPKTSALQKVEGYRDSYVHVDNAWLPASRTVVLIAEETSPRVRTIRLRKHEKLTPTAGG
jgi:hypothetical protein